MQQPLKPDDLCYLIRSDLHRYAGKSDSRAFWATYFNDPGFCYTFWMRLCASLRPQHRVLSLPARFILRHYQVKFGISIPAITQIGSGFYIGHFGGIVVNHRSVIGKNCNISHGVTLGQTNRGERQGCPTLGDNVYIAPGAKLIGGIHIGSDVAIGANSVVTSDVPDHAVVVGIPGKVLSYDGSAGYINRTDYD